MMRTQAGRLPCLNSCGKVDARASCSMLTAAPNCSCLDRLGTFSSARAQACSTSAKAGNTGFFCSCPRDALSSPCTKYSQCHRQRDTALRQRCEAAAALACCVCCKCCGCCVRRAALLPSQPACPKQLFAGKDGNLTIAALQLSNVKLHWCNEFHSRRRTGPPVSWINSIFQARRCFCADAILSCYSATM